MNKLIQYNMMGAREFVISGVERTERSIESYFYEECRRGFSNWNVNKVFYELILHSYVKSK